MWKCFISFTLLAFAMSGASAAIHVNNSGSGNFQNSAVNSGNNNYEYYADEAEDIATLEQDIKILDEEIAKCKKQKKGWIAATVVGGVGTVSTGVAAAVQGVKLKNTKDEVKDKKQQLKDLKQEISDLGGGNSSKKNDKK